MIKNFFIRTKKLFFYIIFSRYIFSLPSKKDILIFDNNNVNFFKKYLPDKKINILYKRGEEFNFKILLKNFINFKFSMMDYFNSYIKMTNPKIIITFSDNDTAFFMLKKNYAKKIIIQNAWKNEHDDHIFRNIKNLSKKKNFNLDYAFIFNKFIGKKYNILSKCKYYKIGSFKSNSVPIKFSNKRFDILYISSWNDINENFKITPNLTWSKFNHSQTLLVKYLSDYAKKNNLILYVYGKMTSKKKSKKEEHYYKNILVKNNWKFISCDMTKTYKIIDEARLVVTLNSTLGYESFARGNKTAFFSLRHKKKNLFTTKFGWPSRLPDKGFFWTDKLSNSSCKILLDRIINANKRKWNKIKNKYQRQLMLNDPNNSKFKSLIKRLSEN